MQRKLTHVQNYPAISLARTDREVSLLVVKVSLCWRDQRPQAGSFPKAKESKPASDPACRGGVYAEETIIRKI